MPFCTRGSGSTGSDREFLGDVFGRRRRLQSVRHGRPITVRKGGGKSPVQLLGDIIKATVNCIRILIVTHGVAGDAVLAEMIGVQTING